ncbi:MAG: hypothetical protein NVS1B2_22900 [Vulcanimicrobiaceae bacterium]
MLSHTRVATVALALTMCASFSYAFAETALVFEEPNARLTPGALGPDDATRVSQLRLVRLQSLSLRFRSREESQSSGEYCDTRLSFDSHEP